MLQVLFGALWLCTVPPTGRKTDPEVSAITSAFRYVCAHRGAGQAVFLRLLAGRDSSTRDRSALATRLRDKGYPIWAESRVPARDSVVLEVLPLERSPDTTPTFQVFYLWCVSGQQYRSFALFRFMCDYIQCEVDDEVGSASFLDQRTGTCEQLRVSLTIVYCRTPQTQNVGCAGAAVRLMRRSRN